MTYFVDKLPSRSSRDLFEFESSTSEVMGAAAQQAFTENPTNAILRMLEIEDAEYGRPVNTGGQMYSGDLRRMSQELPLQQQAPDTPRLTADQARARIAEQGLPLTVPDDGIQEGTLNIIMERKREELQRQAILGAAPKGSAPVALLSAFAASVVDPLNIVAAFVPVVGEARYASLLSKAGGAGGRFGVRAGVGALEGAVGTALVEPLVLAAAAQDQADYDMTDSLTNLAFGSILGGGLRSIGGGVADMWRGASKATNAADAGAAVDSSVARQISETEAPAGRWVDDSPEAIQALAARQMQDDVIRGAEVRATDSVLQDLAEELAPVASSRVGDVADLKAEQVAIGQQLDSLDDSIKQRAKDFQSEGMTRKQAERAARDAVDAERATLQARADEVEARLNENRTNEQARADLSQVRKGKVPERYRDRVESKAQEIRQGVQQKPLANAIRSARDTVAGAPHGIRVAALKTGMAQAMRGQPIDVEDIFKLTTDPERALQSIRDKAGKRAVDAEADALSARVDEMLKASKDDHAQFMRDAEADERIALEVAEQTGLVPDLAEATRLADDAATYSRAWRAAAVCSLRG